MGWFAAMTSLVDRLLPSQLWARIQPLLPPPPPRPRGGVPRHVPDRNCVAALLFMARTSTPWNLLPAKELGCGSATTRWRRLDEWARAGVFEQLQAVLLDKLGEADIPEIPSGLVRVQLDGPAGLPHRVRCAHASPTRGIADMRSIPV